MTSNKSFTSPPTGNAKSSGTEARPGTLDIYCFASSGAQTYIGNALDKNKLAFFSRAADRHLNPEQYGQNRRFTPKKAKPSSTLLLPNADKRAAEIILKWINDNSITDPKSFELSTDLFGHEALYFDFGLDVHRAGHVFDLKPGPRGQVLRDALFTWIRERTGGDKQLSAEDFKNCMEKASFDGGITSSMMNKVMWLSIVRQIPQATLDEIKQYCRETGRYGSMQAFGEEIIKKRRNAGKAYKGRVETSGW